MNRLGTDGGSQTAHRGVRNRVGWRDQLHRLQGGAVVLDLSGYDPLLVAVDRLGEELRSLSDAQLHTRARELRQQAVAGASLDDLRCRVFALVREVADRVLGQRPFDVQVVAALALHAGAVVEMQTGEGKTLTAVMPAVLNALTGRGVHVLTFNDYLARRDAEWMGPIYEMAGVSVTFVEERTPRPARRAAYGADVTYVTAKEAGFDHLRDLLALDPADLVHRRFHCALVDEADSLMVDEARVPLVIAGSVERTRPSVARLAELIASLTPGVHFGTDEYRRDVELTDEGIEHVEQVLGCGSLHADANYLLLTELGCALHARVLLRRDVDYIVRNGRIEIVDEFTGRVVEDRKWPDGLQAALEAKEGLTPQSDGRILGSITVQRFLRRYPRLCGMTGTARDAAFELRQVYGTDVVVIPTHRPMIRRDRPDAIFTHQEAKERALVDEVRRAHIAGRPVLVGTASVEQSERLAQRLERADVRCAVLNAKNDAEEARIVARAGAPGAVTISTNMAGRGTDIRLGGEREDERARVAALGGLYVLGTTRHESHRVDLQLRGRAGRQGDPGESRTFLALDDDLLVRFGIRTLVPANYLPERSDDPVDNPVLRREIARAQRIVEGQNIEIRRTLARYASVIEDQHESLMERRQGLLLGEIQPDVWRGASGGSAAHYASLVRGAGAAAAEHAERMVTLYHIDAAWREHLELCATLREGIHLVRLGGQDPLQRFTSEAMHAFSRIEESIDAAVRASLDRIQLDGSQIDLAPLGLKAPASTWAYLVNDDPFRKHLGSLLTGAGGVSVAIYSAFVLMPLFLLWGVVDRFFKKVGGRSSRPVSTR